MTPYRIEVAGGWCDQQFLNMFGPCKVITLSIRPGFYVQPRSGLASSTQAIISKLINPSVWSIISPQTEPKMARFIYSVDGGGSQDAYGICCRGLNILHYDNSPSPREVEPMDPEHAVWLQENLKILLSPPRPEDYNPISVIYPSAVGLKALNAATDHVIEAIRDYDAPELEAGLQESYFAQCAMIPAMTHGSDLHSFAKWSGCGYGYYLTANPALPALPYKVRI